VIVDTSAICAILFAEPDAGRYIEAIAAAPEARISAVTLVEATTVIEGRRTGTAPTPTPIDRWVAGLGAEICPVTERTARLAQEGWRRFGKGRHPAKLNLGDCFAYALAIERDEPLLFKGDDFAQTDVKRAL
jgi:ribonuclease VapC